MNLITQWHNDGRTVLTVLHDFAFVKLHFPQTLLLAGRPVAWGATADVMSADNLGKVENFVEAWDEAASDREIEAA